MSQENCTADGRRFTLLILESFLLPDNDGFLVTGNLHGLIKTGDHAYLVDPGQHVFVSQVVGIDILEETDGEETSRAAKQAANQTVTLHLTTDAAPAELPKYTVLTSLRPQHAVSADREIENGQLVGLLMEFGQCSGDAGYFSALVYSLCHANFLAAIYSDTPLGTSAPSGTGQAGGPEIEFPLLNDAKDANTTLLPIFTDGPSLSLWKGIFSDVRKPKFLILRFPDIVRIAREHNGAVVNPFGPGTLVLPNDFIARIIATKGYQDEFGMNANNAEQLSETKLASDQQVQLVIPKETPELALIREEILFEIRRLPSVRAAYLLLKQNTIKDVSYYCIIDCPPEEARPVFEKISRDTTPYLQRIKRIEFIPAAALTIPDSIAAAGRIYPEASADANGDMLETPASVSLSGTDAGNASYEGTSAAATTKDYDIEANEKRRKAEAEQKAAENKDAGKNAPQGTATASADTGAVTSSKETGVPKGNAKKGGLFSRLFKKSE